MRRGVINILRTWDHATDAERLEGMNWYQSAHVECTKLHPSIETACGVVASVSPGLKWAVNIEAARRIISGESTDGLGRIWPRNYAKAYAILAGESPDEVLGRKKQSGHKVRAFYANLVNPANWVSVCVDGHAYGVWCGERIPLDAIPSLTRKQYANIASDYTRVADKLAVLPNQVQAVTWIAWRRVIGL